MAHIAGGRGPLAELHLPQGGTSRWAQSSLDTRDQRAQGEDGGGGENEGAGAHGILTRRPGRRIVRKGPHDPALASRKPEWGPDPVRPYSNGRSSGRALANLRIDWAIPAP